MEKKYYVFRLIQLFSFLLLAIPIAFFGLIFWNVIFNILISAIQHIKKVEHILNLISSSDLESTMIFVYIIGSFFILIISELIFNNLFINKYKSKIIKIIISFVILLIELIIFFIYSDYMIKNSLRKYYVIEIFFILYLLPIFPYILSYYIIDKIYILKSAVTSDNS